MADGANDEAVGDNPEQAPSEEVVGDVPSPKKAKRKSAAAAAAAGKRKSKRASTLKKEASKKAVDKEQHAPDPPESEAYSEIKEQLNQRYSLGRIPEAVKTTSFAKQDLEVGRNPKVLLSKKSSILASSDDPFATREGKTLLWRDINMVLSGKKDGEKDRYLLEGVWGEVPQRKTTAIMGPSGAGKTSLLNILAGRAASRGRVSIQSEIRLNNYVVDPKKIEVRQHIAFVAQDDSLQVTATPRESIYFSAKLRLPKDTPEKTLIKLTNKMLQELGLEKCADTFVGGALLKGISGGERKRTSIGVELVVKPAMVFLDEPTSGLDSFSAMQVCRVLQKVAHAGSSVLFTIHQPASDIFNQFDQLILLNRGRVMYQGAVDDIEPYFQQRGHPLPPRYNPADWIMTVAQSVPWEELISCGFFPEDKRHLPDPDTEIFVDGKDASGHHSDEMDDKSYIRAGILTQVHLLYSREIRNITRDKASIGARFGLTIFLAVLIGIIFLDVGNTDKAKPQNLQSHFGALIMVVLMSMFGTAQPALLAFPEERPVFLREYSTSHYSVVAYFMARLSMEASLTALQVLLLLTIDYFLISLNGPFGIMYIAVYALAMSSTALAVLLGCAVEDPKLGQEMLPILFVPQMLFAGFFVVPELIPVWLRWARYLCSLTWAIRIIMVEEFGNGCGGGEADAACERVLNSVGASEDETWWNWLILIGLFVVFRLGALFILRQKALKFY
ncbi:unnamed protein product [Cylindrotheca closterium]|uniref:ABC transporter domain-containing protein n=1 Tax=Cylindrotheca closterium TaxID=2856 RepID=A0AAD2G8G0_9STRA|nr:unnamed protein product [Cylindrotheca closterium]